MAKYSCELHGSFNHFCQFLKNELINSSFSASIEDEHYYDIHDVHVGILILERYSYTGGNRLSLSITITEYQNHLHVTAISSGGSQAIFTPLEYLLFLYNIKTSRISVLLFTLSTGRLSYHLLRFLFLILKITNLLPFF